MNHLPTSDFCIVKSLMASLKSNITEQKTKMDSDVLYLPQEIIKNILIRLRVKSLLRFRCVCKDWKNLIKNPSFIADHLQQSSNENASLIFECDTSIFPSRWCWRLLDCELQLREVPKAPLISSLGFSIVGCCSGLLLVETYQYEKSPPRLFLWNPATTAVSHVPMTRTDCYESDDWVTGFGFSEILNDYKIVRIYAEPYDAVNRVEVFSLSRRSWKGIDIGKLERVKLNYGAVTVNGAIFWTGVKLGAKKEDEHEDDVEVTVSFDIAKEVFTLLPRPDLGYAAEERLTVCENKLAILCDIWKQGEAYGFTDLWVLDKGSCARETWSWTKTYTSVPISLFLDSEAIWRNQIVCQPVHREDIEKGRHVLYLMDVTTNEVKRFVIPYSGPIHRVHNYVESLLPVGNNYTEES